MNRDAVNLTRALQLHAHVLAVAVEFLIVEEAGVLPILDFGRPRIGNDQRRAYDQHAVPLPGEHLVRNVREHDNRLAETHVDPQRATADPFEEQAGSDLKLVEVGSFQQLFHSKIQSANSLSK